MSASRSMMVLMHWQFDLSSEATLQNGIAEALRAGGMPFEREHRFDAQSRIDFWLPASGTGIEVKLKCKKRAIYRQLERYSHQRDVRDLLLVTNTFLGLPDALNGVPVHSLFLGASQL